MVKRSLNVNCDPIPDSRNIGVWNDRFVHRIEEFTDCLACRIIAECSWITFRQSYTTNLINMGTTDAKYPNGLVAQMPAFSVSIRRAPVSMPNWAKDPLPQSFSIVRES